MLNLKEVGKLNEKLTCHYGGKIHWLDKLAKKGMRIPKGYVIDIDFFEQYLGFNNINLDDIDDGVFRYDEVRRRIYDGEFSEVQEGYLSQIFNNLNAPIIVRSSSAQEDSMTTSCAGIFRSIGSIFEFKKFCESVKLCWIASFSELVNAVIGEEVSYRINLLVQEEIQSDIGGVAFGINPVNNNPGEIVIEASSKGPKAAVEGRGEVEKYVYKNDENNSLLLPEIQLVALQLQNIEKVMNVNADVEWLVKNGQLYIIQARPITTWKEKKKVGFISVDDTNIIDYDLKNCAAMHSRWMEKKGVIRKVCVQNDINIGGFYYYFLNNDPDRAELKKLIQKIGSDMIEINDSENVNLLSKEKILAHIEEIDFEVIRIGESVTTEIAGFSSIIDNKIYFEAVKGGFTGFYSGDFVPTKYVTDLDGHVLKEDSQWFSEEYYLDREENWWKKRRIESIQLKLSHEQIIHIAEMTKKLNEKFSEVRVEWIVGDSKLYLFDATIEKAKLADIYCGGEVISRGKCQGKAKLLTDINVFNKYVSDISVRMGHEMNLLNKKSDIQEVKKNLSIKDSIVICEYPKENLALLINEVKGFIFERGSLLCHLGIILREKEIPAVIVKNAMNKFQDGQSISISDGQIDFI